MFTKILVCCLLQLQFVSKADGVSLTLNPSSIVIGSSTMNPTMSLSVQCSSSGTLDIDTLLQLRLSRRKFTESTLAGIASMKFDGVAKLDSVVPSDIQNRSPNITGSVDVGQKSGTMTLSMNAQTMLCSDQAEFNCSLTYIDTNQNTQTVSDIKNFTVITVPSEVLIDSPIYFDDKGSMQQLNNNSVLPVGTQITYRCTAIIGSVPEGEVIWERSSEMGTINSFIPYTPAQPNDIVQQASRQDGCIYRRTSTMYYNLTQLDEDGISFRCRARSYLGGQLYDALTNQQYRSFTASSSSGSNRPVAGSVATAQGGVIAGAVIGAIAGVVLIIVLIYFLWYRRRSSGESYRTKEEGERPEPPPTDYTYTMPDKKKMDGYDNKGLEEPQEKTRYPRSGRGGFDAREGRNGRGHHNPGMDDEDGGTMHMSSGPIGTGV
ncbi:hypothetical protein ACJMK2_026896 [Sinanodonta woodiana]|uniref:Ig-like domain-containing protein n=1 Tax=Sinanodonta woodiana TaxID=1069815 RepID=A0ABD3XLD3_SINWO